MPATVFSVGFGAFTLEQLVSFVGPPRQVPAFADGLGIAHWGVLAFILACYVVLGMIVDGLAMIFLTVPMFVPLVDGLALLIDPELNWSGGGSLSSWSSRSA